MRSVLLNQDDNDIDSGEFIDKSRQTLSSTRSGRFKMLLRALYGEFVCTTILFLIIYGAKANVYQSNWAPEYRTLISSFVSGLQIVSVTFTFSQMSGAQCNCAVSFALWITKKLSNRKFLLYMAVQCLSSIFAEVLIYLTFASPTTGLFRATGVYPSSDHPDLFRIFSTEFVTTFILVYTAFTVAFEDAESQKKETLTVKALEQSEGLTFYSSTPTSQTGFAPFAIGFLVLTLSFYGGTSGVALNPAYLLGPAIFSRDFGYYYLYVLGEFSGAGAAALMVERLHRFGLDLSP